MHKELIHSLKTCPIVKRGEYNYFIHPITDGVPLIEPALLREVSLEMIRRLNLEGVNRIVTAEAMGIPLSSVISILTDIPFSIVRKREYKLPGEVLVHQSTGYSKGQLYINGINKGDKIVIVDDVISTGGTLNAMISALERTGAEIVDICIAIRRGTPNVSRPYKYLVDIEVTDSVNIIDISR